MLLALHSLLWQHSWEPAQLGGGLAYRPPKPVTLAAVLRLIEQGKLTAKELQLIAHAIGGVTDTCHDGGPRCEEVAWLLHRIREGKCTGEELQQIADAVAARSNSQDRFHPAPITDAEMEELIVILIAADLTWV